MINRFDELTDVAAQTAAEVAMPEGEELEKIGIVNPKDDVGDFFEIVAAIQFEMATIEAALKEMDRLRAAAIRSTSASRDRKISEERDNISSKCHSKLQMLKMTIMDLKEQNKTAIKEKAHTQAVMEVRINVQQKLGRKLKEQLLAFEERQTSFKTALQEKTARQLAIALPDASPEEVGQLVASGTVTAETVMKQKMVGTHMDIGFALQGIQDKYNDVRKLEESIMELHQMFVDIAVLVEEQGEMLNVIEMQVDETINIQDHAEKELKTTIKYQKKNKKMACYIALIVLAICGVLMLMVVVT